MIEDRKIVFDEAGKGRTWGELGKDMTLHDEENPLFLLSVTDLSLVRQIAEGRIEELGDTSTLADPSVVTQLVQERL